MANRDTHNHADNRDRILPETRVLAGFIAPFLVLAFLILFFLPHETEQRFAWGIGPQMTAMMLGATYLTGVFYFTTVLFARRWQEVKFGLIPVTAFASLLGIATIIHWGNFTHGHIAFWLWAGLYFTTPFAVFFVWLRNTRYACLGPPQPGDLLLPPVVRGVVGLVGASGVLTSILLFVVPNVMIDIWPWTLSALTARVMAAMFMVFSLFAVAAFFDPRWDSLRILNRSQLISPLVFLAAMIASWDNFDTANPLTWLFAFNVVVVFTIGVPVLYLYMETRRKRAAGPKTPAPPLTPVT